MKRKLIPIIVLFSGLMLLVIFVQHRLSWEELVAHELTLRARIAAQPFLAVVIGFTIYVVISFVPGASGKSLIVGWLFGVWAGVFIVNVGLTIVAVLTFLASRYLFRDAVQSRFGHHIQRIDDAVQRDGASYLFMLRMLHAPYTLTNYAFGATAMRTRGFWWATQLGLLPQNIIFVYAGSQVPSLRQLADEGPMGAFSWPLIWALILLSVVTVLIRYVAGRSRMFRASHHA